MLSTPSRDRLRLRARFIACTVALASVLPIARGDDAAASDRAIATILDLNSLRTAGPWDLHHPRALSVSGTVTYVSISRDSFVIQEGATAVSFHGDVDLSSVPVGARVHVTSETVYPTIAGFPGFPFRPTHTEMLDRLHVTPSQGSDYVDRLRAYLIPPITGAYRFWIASDDTSELWLSSDESPENARAIASVPAWTFEAEWTTYRAQASAPIELQQGRRYYVEVLHEQGAGADHIDVAWQDPTGPREFVPHACLAPFPRQGAADQRRGVSREIWAPWAIASPADLQPGSAPTNRYTLHHAAIEVLGQGSLPAPLPIKAGRPLEDGASFRWAEVVAEVRSAQRTPGGLDLELVDGESKLVAHIQRWSGDDPFEGRGYIVRLAGACEAAFNARGELLPGALWIPQLDRIPIVAPSSSWEQLSAPRLKDLANVTIRPDEDIPIRLKGRVRSQATPRQLVLQEDTGISALVSTDGTTWRPVGEEVVTPLSDSVLAGFAVSSYDPRPAVATFDRVAGLTMNFTGDQVGNPPRHGEFSRHGGVFNVTGYGHDIWDWEDEFYFVHEPLSGDAEIVARVTPREMHNTWTKAGLMIRESLAPDSPFVDLVNAGGLRVSLQWRIRNPHHTTEAVYLPDNDTPAWFKLVLRRRTIPVSLVADANLSPGESVEAVGYLKKTATGIEVVRGFTRPLDARPTPDADDDDRPLVDIKSLQAWQKSGLPNHFRVRGVVTCNHQSGWTHYFAVQDASGAAFFLDSNQSNWRIMRPGTLVEIYSDPIASVNPAGLIANKVMAVGPGVMPQPLRHPAELTEPAKGEGRWIELEGIVYAASGDAAILRAAGSYIGVEADEMTHDDWARLVDRKIRIQGVAAYRSTSEVTVFVPGKAYVETLGYDALSAASPPRSIADFIAAKSISDPAHREHVVGTVTFVHGQQAIVDDGSATASVQLSGASSSVKSGDKAEVFGFPVLAADGSLTLLYADMRRLGSGSLPAPAKSTAAEVLDGRFAQHFVTIEADLIAKGGTATESLLEMQAGGRKFRVWCPARSPAIDSIAAESHVQLTGFASRTSPDVPGAEMSVGSPDRAALFIVPSAADIVVLRGPPWLRLRQALYVLGILAGILVVALVWVQVLRRRVEQRTDELNAAMNQLRRETEVAATLTERQRLAGEIHDSLEQGISGIMLQLEGALQSPACPPDVHEILRVARNMVSFSHAEIRHAIWDLHSPILEGNTLQTALQQLAQTVGGRAPAIDVTVHGTPVALAPELDHHLLRIAQEAVTNAVKHAKASKIEVELTYRPEAVELRVKDDGCGFATESHFADQTHFGLRSLRRRAKNMDARLTLRSTPNGGTVVEVVAPLQISVT
jgi:signal transduction histidine kinase